VLDVVSEHFDESVCCPIIFLSGSHMGGPGHHTVQILTHAVSFLRGVLNYTVYKNNRHTIKELKQEISSAMVIVSNYLQFCEISYVGCRWSWTPMMHVLRMLFCVIADLPRSLNSEKPNTVTSAVQLKLELPIRKTVLFGVTICLREVILILNVQKNVE
jgi:hypothetical protein